MAANTRKFNTISISSGAIYRKFRDILDPTTLELLDLSNDFRMMKVSAADNINNDFRMVMENKYDIDNDFRTVKEETKDISNDFRMYGTFARLDINNDFRFADWAVHNVDNDFRMVGEIVKGDIVNDFRTQKLELSDINNKFNTIKEEVKDVDNKFNSCIEKTEDVNNLVSWVGEKIYDIDNDFRTKKKEGFSVGNDFRMVAPWQVPQAGEVGFQSAGKLEIKVYINDIEQTDVDIDSMTVNPILAGASTASFNLGRAYDASKPSERDVVKIRYKGILLYQGYITEINSSNNPESIRIDCQDEYWKMNKDKKYFLVGRKPADAKEFYYETIKEGLNALGLNFDIGNFIPQTMNLYGSGHADAITQLIQNTGNFSWFIKPDGTKCLWQADRGNIINLEKQTLGTNVGLYQVIKHNIKESIIGIINRLRVLMGDWIIKETSGDISKGAGFSYTVSYPYHVDVWAESAWDTDYYLGLDRLSKDTNSGYGYDKQDPDEDYRDVFRKFWLPDMSSGWTIIGATSVSLTDQYPPIIEIYGMTGYGGSPESEEYKSDGFSLDYGFRPPSDVLIPGDLGRPSLTLSEAQFTKFYTYFPNNSKEVDQIKAKKIRLQLWKELRWSGSVSDQSNPDDEPDADGNPLMFYTDKMGTYPETITGTLNLSGLSKQDGTIIIDENGEIIETIPTWDDTDFAKDIANWNLSKTCDKKISGSIDITIDSFIYHNIDLSKRIKIDGVVEPINIKSISINFNSWVVSLNVEKNRYYKRSETIQYRGE